MGEQIFVPSSIPFMKNSFTQPRHKQIFSLDAGLRMRMEGLPDFKVVWDCVLKVPAPTEIAASPECSPHSDKSDHLSLDDQIPTNFPQSP